MRIGKKPAVDTTAPAKIDKKDGDLRRVAPSPARGIHDPRFDKIVDRRPDSHVTPPRAGHPENEEPRGLPGLGRPGAGPGKPIGGDGKLGGRSSDDSATGEPASDRPSPGGGRSARSSSTISSPRGSTSSSTTPPR